VCQKLPNSVPILTVTWQYIRKGIKETFGFGVDFSRFVEQAGFRVASGLLASPTALRLLVW